MIGAGAEGGAVRRVFRELGRVPGTNRGAAAAGDASAADSAEIELLYRVVGRGTALIADLRDGERVSLVGPLGRGFLEQEQEQEQGQEQERVAQAEPGPALLVGGGTGIASLYELARLLIARGRSVRVLLGARGAADLLAWSDFGALGCELIGATEDGSAGVKGLVTRPLADCLASTPRATVYAVGPTPMMRACAELAARHAATCIVSLENPMACGFGVCLGCAAPRASGGYALVCRTGPVFDAREIDWAGLP
jgi:dihydroorotate dehydrogenase electron transfer subunit